SEKVALLRRPIDARMQQLKTVKHQRDFEKLQASETENAKQRVVKGLMAEEEKKKQIAELMKQFNTLYKEGKYRESEMIAMRARELDPDDTVAGAAITMARMQANQVKYKDLKKRKEDLFVDSLDEVEDPGPTVDLHNPVAVDLKTFQQNKSRKGINELL